MPGPDVFPVMTRKGWSAFFRAVPARPAPQRCGAWLCAWPWLS